MLLIFCYNKVVIYMKKFLIKIIELYQATPGNWHYHCRFTPTCSQYAKEAIEIHGSWIGLKLTIKDYIEGNFGGGNEVKYDLSNNGVGYELTDLIPKDIVDFVESKINSK